MALETSDRVTVGWDDPYPEVTTTEGVVVGWFARNGQPRSSAVIALDHPLTAEGAVPGTSDRDTRTGAFLVITPRFVGQAWDHEGGVQVSLFDAEPTEATAGSGLWIATQAAYQRLS